MTLRRFTDLDVRALALLAGLWFVGAVWIVPWLIRLGYRGEGPAPLARLMEGRDATPLSEYLGTWSTIAWGVTVAATAVAVFAYLVAAWELSPRGRAARARVEEHERVGARLDLSLSAHLRLGAAVGLATGFIIGAQLATLSLVFATGVPTFLLVGADVLWLAPLSDVWTFLAVAVLIFAVGTIVRPLRSARVVAFLLLLLSGYSVLMVGGRLHWMAGLALASGAAYQLSRYVPAMWDRLKPALGRWALVLAVAVIAVALAVRGWDALRHRRAFSALPEEWVDAPNVLLVVFDAVRADHLSA
ncbi:MAG: hypothetical protein ACRELC_11390, partial [Gemmatimonadota bacterium]